MINRFQHSNMLRTVEKRQTVFQQLMAKGLVFSILRDAEICEMQEIG